MKFRNQAPPLQPVERNGNIPLSFPQERLWLLEQLNPGSADYNIPYAFRVKGKLDVPALAQSLNEIRSRHEPLRTTFESVNGQPVQVISPATPSLTLTVVDLQELPENLREAEAQALVTDEATRPFDIKYGPLFRTSLLKLAAEDHLVLITLHHIIYDAWSDGVLFRELATLYEAFAGGKPSSLPELPIQYADFAVWQRQWLQGEFLENLLNFWKQELKGLPILKLPTDRPRPAVASGERSRQALVLPKTLTQQLNAFTSSEGVTPFITLLAAFNVLLHCYMGQDDIFLCTPIANRNRNEIQKQIGYFVNLLVYRNDLSGNPTFKELLSRVRQGSARAYTHQDLPIQLLASELNLVNVPLSQVLFALQNVVLQSPKLGDLAITPLEEQRGTDFDLFMSMEEEADELTAVLKYNIDLFDDATMTQMLQHFQTILENIVANPEQPISQLLPLSEAQKQQLRASREHLAASVPSKGDREKTYVAPRNSLETQLTKIWEEVLKIEPIGIKDNFFELGGKSLVAVSMFAQIEKVLGKNLPLSTLFEASTIEELANRLSQEGWVAPWSAIVPIQPRGSRPPLFCVHGAAGNVLLFSDLACELGSDQPFYGLQCPGLDGKQPLINRVEDLAAHYVEEIRKVQIEGPYYLGGYSFGGIVAFEMAQQLQQQGQTVAIVAMLDSASPKLIARTRNMTVDEKSHFLFQDFLSLSLKEKLMFPQKYISRKIQRYQKQLNGMLPKFYRAIGRPIPVEILPSHVEKIYKLSSMNYVPKVYSGKVTLFRAATQPVKYQDEALLGWDGVAAGGIEVIEVSGRHAHIHNDSMLKKPQVQILAVKLKDALEKAQSEGKIDPHINVVR
jgi:thioesterase domain-containing protein/acyl carrier protein